VTTAPTGQPLLTELRLGDLTLPNRVVMAPMTRARATNAERAPTPAHARYYAQRAGAGLLVSEGTWTSALAIGADNVPGLYTDAQTAAWATVTEAVHRAGGRIFAQLGHTGAKSHPDHLGGALPAAPSAVNIGERRATSTGMKDTVTPRAFTADEVAGTIADFRAAAANARRAGFDGVEIHAQGSHLIPQFLNPRLNRRTDAYGGSTAARARFLLEVLDAVTGVWDGPRVGVKLSPYWSGGTFTADEVTLTRYDWLIGELNNAGLAYLHLMGPAPAQAPGDHNGGGDHSERLAAFGRYRALYRGTLVANVGFTRTAANTAIERGVTDAVSFGLPFIANPDLVDRFAHGYPLADLDPATLYTGGESGYTDYPTATATALPG
jgi:N-ethylmaleimide reductase